MFSAMTGFFRNPSTGSTGRITFLFGVSPYDQIYPGSPNQKITYYSDGSWIVTGNDGTTAKPGCNVRVNNDGTINWQKAYDVTDGPYIASPALDSSNNIVGVGRLVVGGATNYAVYCRISSAGTSPTNATTSNPLPTPATTFTAYDSINNRILYSSYTDTNLGNGLRVGTGGTGAGLVPTVYRTVTPSTGTINLVNYNAVCGSGSSRLCVVGRYNDGTNNNSLLVISGALPLTTTTSFAGYSLINTSGTLFGSRANGITSNGNDVYITGGAYNTAGYFSTYLAKYTIGATPVFQWAKLLTNSSTLNKQGQAVYYASNGNVFVIHNDYNPTSLGIDSYVITCWNPTTSTVSFSKKLTITTTNGRFFGNARLFVTSTDIYIGTSFYLSTGANGYAASFQFPIDGSIPGSGTYNVGGFTFTYATASESVAADAFTNGTVTLSSTAQTITTAAQTPTLNSILSFTPSTTTI